MAIGPARTLRSAWLLVVSLATTLAMPACAAEAEGPPDLAVPDQDDTADELTAYEIGEDEVVVDAEDFPDVDSVAADDPELEENPFGEETGDEEDVPEDVEEDLGVSPQSVSLLRREPLSVPIKSRKWKCRAKTSRPCVCLGSPMNCQLPNDQPGRNRYLPPETVAEIERRGGDKEHSIEAIGKWEVSPETPVYDGAGRRRGANFKSPCFTWAGPSGSQTTLDPTRTCAKLNFGQKKRMKVEGDSAFRTYVYAFNVFLHGELDASSWIPLDSVVRKADVAAMKRTAPPRITSFTKTSYVVKSAEDWGKDPATFTAADLPSWAQAKVAKGPGSRAVRDYLLRDGNVINLAYQTPGVGGAGTDTFLVRTRSLGFRRVLSTRERPALVRVPVAHPTRKSMVFAYGRMGGRYGWMALAALRVGTPLASARSVHSCTGKADGTYCSELVTYGVYACEGGRLVARAECESPKTQKCLDVEGGTTAMCTP